MKKQIFMTIIFLIVMNMSFATSLWNNSGGKSLFADRRASEVGDIVSIVIKESAQSTSSTSDAKSKSGSVSNTQGTGALSLLPELSAGGKTALSNSDQTKRSGSLTASVSAKIEKKEPNGNLFIRGIRKVLINNELQEIEISGYVRSDDISANNTVESSYLANAEIKYNGKMVFDGSANPGLISNVLSGIIGFFF